MAVIPPADTASASTVRQLKWLVIVLAASNVLIGLFSVFALRQADRRYSELLGQSVPVLNDLQTLTAAAAQAMVSTNVNRLVENDAPKFVEAANAAVREDVALRNHLLEAKWLEPDDSERRAMRSAGEAFTSAANDVISLVQNQQIPEAARVREGRVRPAFYSYLNAITKAADVLESESERLNVSESQRTTTLSNVLLGVASWPVLIVLTLLLLTAIFVLVLMLLFRGREISDMP